MSSDIVLLTSEDLVNKTPLNIEAKNLYKETIRNKDEIINALNNQLHEIKVQNQELSTTLFKMQQNIIEIDLKDLDLVQSNEEHKILTIDVSEVANEASPIMKLDSRIKILKEIPDQNSKERGNMFEVLCNRLITKNNEILQKLEHKNRQYEQYMLSLKNQIEQNQEQVREQFMKTLKEIQTKNAKMSQENEQLKIQNNEHEQKSKDVDKNNNLLYEYNLKIIDLASSKKQLQQKLKITTEKYNIQSKKYKQLQSQSKKQIQEKNKLLHKYIDQNRDSYSHNSDDERQMQKQLFKEECQNKVKQIEKKKEKEVAGLNEKIDKVNEKISNQNTIIEKEKVMIQHLKKKYQILLDEFQKYKNKTRQELLKSQKIDRISPMNFSIQDKSLLLSPNAKSSSKQKSKMMKEKELFKGKKMIRLGY